MATGAKGGVGTLFKMVASPSTTYALIGEVIDIAGPNESAEMLDVTNMDSTYVERIAGVPDGGQITLTINHKAATYTTVRAALSAGALQNFQITPVGATNTIVGSAYVSDCHPSFGVHKQHMMDVTLAITGPLTTS